MEYCKGKLVDNRWKASSRRNSSMVKWMIGLQLFFGWRFHLVSPMGALSAYYHKLFFRKFSYTKGMTVFSNLINNYFGPSADTFNAEFMWTFNTSSCCFFITNTAFQYFFSIVLQCLGTFFNHSCWAGLNNIRNVYYCFYIWY